MTNRSTRFHWLLSFTILVACNTSMQALGQQPATRPAQPDRFDVVLQMLEIGNPSGALAELDRLGPSFERQAAQLRSGIASGAGRGVSNKTEVSALASTKQQELESLL